jgi:hypothetical protein
VSVATQLLYTQKRISKEGNLQAISSFFLAFSTFINATRTCESGGVWSDVNFTPCVLTSIDVEPFLLFWLNFAAFSFPSDPAGQEQLISNVSGYSKA